MTIDLDAYFDRIGYRGRRAPTLPTLRELHALHPLAIAFESIDPWLGRPVSIAPEAIASKLIYGRRGGFCYEHNMLFWCVLEQLGYPVRALSARVVYSTPPAGGRHPRNHMLMLVSLSEGDFIADVGFGGLTLTAPLRLEAGPVQPTPHEPIKLSRSGGQFVLEAKAGEQWRAMYQFGLEDYIVPDFEMANWFMSTYPGSPFVARLVAARPLADRRLALANTSLSIHHLNGPTEKRSITSVGALRRLLEQDFAIALDELPMLDDKLKQLVVEAE